MRKYCLLLFVAIFLGFETGNGQYTVLLNFNSTVAQPYGDDPGGSLTFFRNTLYGMVESAGLLSGNGGIFKIDTNGNGYKELFGFSGTFGSYPINSLIREGNIFYGMTQGALYGSSWGNVFSFDTNGNVVKSLHNFNRTDGEDPRGSLILSEGKLFGMTSGGGTFGDGNLFSVDTDGNNFKELLDFSGTNGASPMGDVTLSGGVLFGMTSRGGSSNKGIIFSIDTDGTGYRDILDFIGANDALPMGNLTLFGNKFFGMTSEGGSYDSGCIFSIDTNGSGYKDLLDFNGLTGIYPQGSLTVNNNKMLGMTWKGGATNNGCIFSSDTDGSRYKDMWDFHGFDGALPRYGILTSSGNALYGMTYIGGLYGFGVIFKIDTTNITTSINKLDPNFSSIIIFPNPSAGIFKISIAGVQNFVSGNIEVYNVLGEKVLKETICGAKCNNVISLTGQPNGVYFYRALRNDRTEIGNGKLVIDR